jgi:hypothetical protein
MNKRCITSRIDSDQARFILKSFGSFIVMVCIKSIAVSWIFPSQCPSIKRTRRLFWCGSICASSPRVRHTLSNVREITKKLVRRCIGGCIMKEIVFRSRKQLVRIQECSVIMQPPIHLAQYICLSSAILR